MKPWLPARGSPYPNVVFVRHAALPPKFCGSDAHVCNGLSRSELSRSFQVECALGAWCQLGQHRRMRARMVQMSLAQAGSQGRFDGGWGSDMHWPVDISSHDCFISKY